MTAVEIVPLGPEHDLAAFDCGDPVRHAWLCNRALSNQRTDDSRTYVAVDGTAVVGFHAIAVGSIIRASLPEAMRRNAPDPISCVLLGQLAVALRMQKHGLGRILVVHAMARADRVATLAGCRLFGVSPSRPELVGYYERFGFADVSTSPPLMVMTLPKLRATLAALDIHPSLEAR